MATDQGGLLGFIQSPTARDIGLGLLSQSGPVVGQPAPSLGQAFGVASQQAIQRERERLRNDFLRQEMADRSRRREAIGELQGLLGNQAGSIQGPDRQINIGSVDGQGGQSTQIPGLMAQVPQASTPEGQQQLTGLLSEIAPEAVTEGLINQAFPGQERAEPSQVRIARILADPNESEQVKESIRQQIDADSNTTQQQMFQLDLLKTRAQLQQLLQGQQQEAESRQQEQRRTEFQVTSSLNDAAQLAEDLRVIEDTVQETGIPLPDLRKQAAAGGAAIARALGKDTSDIQKQLNALGRFNKTSSRFAANEAVRMFGNQITDAQLGTVQNFMPSTALPAEANRSVIVERIRTLLNEAEVQGIDVDRDKFISLIERLTGQEQRSGNGDGGPRFLGFENE